MHKVGYGKSERHQISVVHRQLNPRSSGRDSPVVNYQRTVKDILVRDLLKIPCSFSAQSGVVQLIGLADWSSKLVYRLI
jgi:hypothetical protein